MVIGSAGKSVVGLCASEVNFRHLGREALDALNLLGAPLYIYGFRTQRILWANPAALSFWNSASEAELCERDLSSASASTEIRLEEYLQGFRRGEVRSESWTFYPKGQPITAQCRCSGVTLNGADEAMLVEIEAVRPFDLLATELRTVEALRHTPLMISLFSDSGQVLMRNPSALALFGPLDRELSNGDAFTAMFEDPAAAASLLDTAIAGNVGRCTARLSIPGRPVHALQLSMVSDPATGRPARLVSQEDVSQLAKVSQQLQASEESLQAVLDLNVAPTIVVAAKDGTVLNANLSASHLLEGTLQTGYPFRAVAADASEDERRELRELLRQGRASAQVRLQSDRGIFWAAVTAAPIRYENDDALALTVIDVDQLYRTAADLKSALSQERTTTALQKRSLAFATHELRTPLAQIDSAAQRLDRRSQHLTPDQIRESAAKIRIRVKKLLSLLENTLGAGRHGLTTMGFSPVVCDINDLIVAYTQTFLESEPQVVIKLALSAVPAISFDRILMEQTLANLLSNALKYSNGTPTIDISTFAQSGYVHVRVRDFGIGIDFEDHEQIFIEYARGKNIESRPGTGLGLSIVRHIMELHGGSASIVQFDGPGTIVELRLPIGPQSEVVEDEAIPRSRRVRSKRGA